MNEGKYLIENEKDIKAAMKVINETPLMKVEDLIDFFPDTTLINHFKDEIASQANTYDDNIKEHRQEMEMIEKNTNILRVDLKKVRDSSVQIDSSLKCTSCRFSVLPNNPFYYFPCSHVFHEECLIRDVTERLEVEKRQMVSELKEKIAYWKKKKEIETRNAKGVLTKADKYKEQLDSIVASDCLLCGDYNIRMIDQSFIQPGDESQQSNWII